MEGALKDKKSWKDEDKAQAIIREFGQIQTMRGTWESHWQEIAQRIWPSMSSKFNPNWGSTAGQKKNELVYDSTAALALQRFAAILDSLLTPRNQTWHTLAAADPSLNKRRDVRLWFEEVNRALFHYRYLPRANFASQNNQNYKSLGAFGSGAMFIDALVGERGTRYRAITLGEIYFVENHQGIVDKAFRCFGLTLRQAIQKWGDKCPKRIHEMAEKDPEKVEQFIHLVEPREDLDYARRDYKGMKFASFYVCKEEQCVIEEGGYNVFPYAISRYEQYADEIYGRSPAMDLLPAIKTLNEIKKTMLKQGHRIVDPVLLAHDDGVLDSFSLKPGAINAGGVSADGRPLVHALPTGNLAVGKEAQDDERALINDGFLVSLFQILTESPQMTATEILERTREKGILLAPTLGRQQSESQGPQIDREIDILAMQGAIPPMPQALREAGGEYKVVYDSPLSRAQKAEEAAGLMRTVQSALEVVNVTQNPEPLDHFKWDNIIPGISDIQGVPYHWRNSLEEVARIRAGRAKMQQAQMAITAAPGAAAMISSAAKAHTATKG
jgi:hypothetical protein